MLNMQFEKFMIFENEKLKNHWKSFSNFILNCFFSSENAKFRFDLNFVEIFMQAESRFNN